MKNNGSLIDTSLKDLIVGQLGGDEAKPILEIMNTYMLQNNIINAPPLVGDGNTQPLLGSGQTKGDWRINLTMPDGQKQDIRPDNALSYTIIREMLKSGPIRFALEMKRAQMVSVFRNRRSVSAYCKNEEMQQVTEFVIEHVLPFAAFEFTWSALVYGSAFMEQVWETKTLSQLGLDGSKYYTIPKQLNLVPHETIRHIKRTNSGDFDGYIQMADYKLGTYYIMATPSTGIFNPGDVDVKMQDALVIPYNGFSRNLWGESFLYPLYPLWFWYEIIIRCLVRYSELMGDPPRLGKAPSRKKVRLSANSNDLVDAIDYLLALAVNLTKSNAVVIPSDVDENGRPEWELGYMQTPDRSQPFVQIIELFNQMILRSALSGDRAFTQAAGAAGSNALGEVHAEATALHNEMVVSSWLHYLNRYWISNISKFNLGENGVPVWLEVQGLDPREREFLTSIAGIAGNSTTFQEFFYMVDWEQLGKMAGMPMLSKEQAAQLKADLAKQAQDQQVEQIRQQNELNIESQRQQAEIQQQFTTQPSPDEEPTNLEVQMQLNKWLNSDNVPIFFTQGEVKSILLGNPFHDNLGKFASKMGGLSPAPILKGIKQGISNVGENIGEGVEAVKEKSGYNKLSPANKKRVKLLATVAAAAAIGTVAIAATGAKVRIDTKLVSKVINGVEFKHYGSKAVDIEKLAKVAFERQKVVGDFMGSAPQLRQMVFADPFQIGKLQTSVGQISPKGFESFIYGAGKSSYESKLDELANSSSLFKVSDIKLGASYLLHKIQGSRVYGFTVFDSGKVFVENSSLKNMSDTITHELVHNVKQNHKFWLRKGSQGLATLEGATEGVNKYLSKGARKSGYDPTVTYLNKLAQQHGLAPAEFFKSMILNPELINIQLEDKLDLSGIELSEEGILLAVIQGQYDLVEDEFMDLIEKYKDDFPENEKTLELFDEDETVQLFNPYHDELGKFTSGKGGGGGAGAATKIAGRIGGDIASTVGTMAGGPLVGAAIGHLTQRAITKRQQDLEARLTQQGFDISQKKFNEQYKKLNFAEKILAKPAEFAARKDGIMPKIARLGLDIAPELAFRYTIGAGLFSNATLLGGAATAAAFGAIFGTAPAAAIIIGGFAVGIGAIMIVNHGLDFAGDAAVRSYLNRYAPKDPYHYDFTHMSNTKKTWKATTITWDITHTVPDLIEGLGIGIAYNYFGPMIGLPTFGGAGLTDQLTNMAMEYKLEKDEPGDIHELLFAMQPYLAALGVQAIKYIRLPYDDQLQYIPGFYVDGNNLVITYETLPELLQAMEDGTIPEIKHIEFGTPPEITIDTTQLEEYQLANPYHDELGRFSAKDGGSSESGESSEVHALWGSLDPTHTPNAVQAQKLGQAVVKDTGKLFKSGLVKDLKVKACDDWQCMKSETGIDKNVLGVYSEGQLTISPYGTAYSAYKSKDFFNRVVAHETTHARKRSGGGGIGLMSKPQSDLEEGLTEIISLNHIGYPYKKSPYIKQMRSVAYTVRKASGGDTTKAWQVANAMHYHNDGQLGLSTYQYYKGDNKFNQGSDDDIDWLFSQRPTSLEITDEGELEETFKKSEEEIYRTVRKVQKQTNIEPRPFTDEELKLEGSILLFNPSHDALGRFAKASGIATIASAGATITGLITSKIAETTIRNKAKEIQKSEGISGSAAREKVYNSKIFEKEIAGKKIGITYGQVHKAGNIVATAGFAATAVSLTTWNIASSMKETSNDVNSILKWKQKQNTYYTTKKPTWPPEANHKDFEKMYSTLVKKYHPDDNPALPYATIKRINTFYSKKDWGGMSELFSSSGFQLELTEENADKIALLVKILYEAIKDNSDFLTFPVPDNVDEVPPFVVIEDEGKQWLVIDKFTAALIVGTVMGNWNELDKYLGEEDEGTDRPIPSEG